MTGIDRSIQRVVVVIALMAVAAVALRGFIPGAEPITERERPASNPAALVIVIVMVCASVAIIAFAIVLRLRDRTATPASAAPLPRGAGGLGRPSWRFTLVVLALVIVWLLLVLLLMRLGASPDQPVAETPAGPETSSTEPEAAPESTPADPTDPDPESDSNIVGYLVPPMLILMVLVIVGTAIASRRQRLGPARYTEDHDDRASTTSATAGDSLVRAAEVGLAEIVDRTREPREAIIACYAAMERELTTVPGAAPLDCDTPSEVLARAVHNRALRADSATELVELFEEARFSPHVMTEAHRDAAMAVLERVLAELPDGSTRSLA